MSDTTLRDALAEALHKAMCPTSHHDRPISAAPCHRRYEHIADSTLGHGFQAALKALVEQRARTRLAQPAYRHEERRG